MARRVPHVGDVVIYWTDAGGQMTEQAAIVTALSSDEPIDRVWLYVLWTVGFGGEGRVWAQYSPTPMDARWSFKPER
jgi:hypothetical protein